MGEVRKFGKGGVAKGLTIGESTARRSPKTIRESMAHRSATKLMRKPKLKPSIRYCVEAGL